MTWSGGLIPSAALAGLVLLVGPLGVAAPAGLAPLLVALVLLVAVAGRNDLRGLLRSAVPPPVFGVLSVFVLWSVASSLWAPNSFRAGELALRVFGLCLVGLVAVEGFARLDPGGRRLVENSLLASLGLGYGLVLVALVYATSTGKALFGDYAGMPLTTLSRGQAVLALLSLPAVAVLWRRGHRVIAVTVAVAVTALFLLLYGHAGTLALGAGLTAMAASALLGRRVLAALAAMAAVAVLVAPLAVRALPSGDVLFQKIGFVWPSAVHRVYTWHFVAEKIAERPLAGWGLDSSRRIPGGDAALRPRVPDPDPAKAVLNEGAVQFTAKSQVLPLHPHNATLQVWLELGLPGALMMAWVVARLYGTPGATAAVGDAALRAGLVTGYLVLGGLSFGAWQSWWIALGWLMAALAAGLSPNSSPASSSNPRTSG